MNAGQHAHGSFVASGKARLWVEREGAGPPVIFLHALCADRRMWAVQRCAVGAVPRGCLRPPRREPDRSCRRVVVVRQAFEMDGVAHLPNLERPDEFNRLLQTFCGSAVG